MEDINKPLSNPELAAAIVRMNRENSRESREAVLDIVISSAQFLAPITIPESAKSADGTATEFQLQLLPNQDGQPFFPAFTSWEELRKFCGPKNQQTLLLTFDDYAHMVLQDNRAAGFVIDPFGACLSFERPMMEYLVQRKHLRNIPQ